MEVRVFIAGALLIPALSVTGAVGLPFVLGAFFLFVFWDSATGFFLSRRTRRLYELVRQADDARAHQQWSQGLQVLEQAEAVARRPMSNREFNLAAILHRKAHVAHQEGRAEVAHAAAREALEIARKIRHPRLPLSKIHFTLAQIELMQESFASATQSCEQAIEYLEGESDAHLNILLLTMLSTAHSGMSKPSTARQYLDAAEQLSRSSTGAKESLLAYIDFMQGADRLAREQFPQAHFYLGRALGMYEGDSASDPRIGASVLGALAALNEREGRLDAADSQARRALALLDRERDGDDPQMLSTRERPCFDEFLRASVLVVLCSVSIAQNRLDDAAHWADLAVASSSPRDMSRSHRFLTERALARLRAAQNRHDEAVALLAAAYRRIAEARRLHTPLLATDMVSDAHIFDQAEHPDEGGRLREWSARIRRDFLQST